MADAFGDEKNFRHGKDKEHGILLTAWSIANLFGGAALGVGSAPDSIGVNQIVLCSDVNWLVAYFPEGSHQQVCTKHKSQMLYHAKCTLTPVVLLVLPGRGCLSELYAFALLIQVPTAKTTSGIHAEVLAHRSHSAEQPPQGPLCQDVCRRTSCHLPQVLQRLLSLIASPLKSCCQCHRYYLACPSTALRWQAHIVDWYLP